MQGRLIFRVDANAIIGRGHISRCLAIAAMLKEDIDILFVSLKNNEAYITSLLNEFKSQFIEKEEDLKQIVQPDNLLWIDGYDFSEDWKREMQKHVKKLIETNDIPYTPKYIDILFNHTPGVTKKQFGGDASSAELYVGLKYVLLRQQFLKIAKKSEIKLSGKGVFICFGGADTYSLGEKFVDELVQGNFKDPIYWVTNTATITLEKYENVIMLSNLDEVEMIHYMSSSKVVLIPSSVLSFEAMALRKPIFTCYFVDNQKLIHQGLVQDELAYGVGYIETSNGVKNVTKTFSHYYKNDSLHKKHVQKQIELLDGNSDNRIRQIINQISK